MSENVRQNGTLSLRARLHAAIHVRVTRPLMFCVFVCVAIVLGAFTEGLAQSKGIDPSKRPDPLPSKSVAFPKYTELKLKNGLKVYVVEDHRQPKVDIRLQIRSGETFDVKPGTAVLTADMITKGAGTRSAQELAEFLDGVGAGVAATAAGDATTLSGSSLKKHLPTMLSAFADVLLRPTFPEEELGKLLQQRIAEVKSEKGSATGLAMGMSRKVAYGEQHPYAIRKTEASLKSITLADVKEYYQLHYKVNNAVMAVIGDVKPKEIQAQLENAIGSWTSGTIPSLVIPEATTMKNGVYFVTRPGSVQSMVMVTAKTIPYKHPDFYAVRMISDLMGGSFGGRLFRTLRETYSYTYTPGSIASSAKEINRIAFFAEVRNSVTDSAIDVILREIEELKKGKTEAEDMNRMKRYVIGQYLMSFESAETIGSLLLFADYLGLGVNSVKDYPKNIEALSLAQIAKTAQTYLAGDNLRIVVVGAPEVKEKLKKFGPVYDYDMDLQEAKGLRQATFDLPELMKRHVQALGGADKIATVKNYKMTTDMKLSIGGQELEGTAQAMWSASGMIKMFIDLGVVKQETVVDSARLLISGSDRTAEFDPTERRKLIEEGSPFHSTRVQFLMKDAKITGIDENGIIVEGNDMSGNPMKYVFGERDYLLKRWERMVTFAAPEPYPSVTVYEDYRSYDGLMLPSKATNERPQMTSVVTTKDVKFNTLTTADFAPSSLILLPKGK